MIIKADEARRVSADNVEGVVWSRVNREISMATELGAIRCVVTVPDIASSALDRLLIVLRDAGYRAYPCSDDDYNQAVEISWEEAADDQG